MSRAMNQLDHWSPRALLTLAIQQTLSPHAGVRLVAIDARIASIDIVLEQDEPRVMARIPWPRGRRFHDGERLICEVEEAIGTMRR